MLIGTQHGNIRVLDADTGAMECTLVGHSQRICCLQTCADDTFVSGSCDGTVRVWCARTFNCVRVFDEHTGAVVCAAVHAHMYAAHSACVHHSSTVQAGHWQR
jgi:F-box/WD-40 domain protein 7